MSIYPSLEDMKATEMIHAQMGVVQQATRASYSPSAPVPTLNRGYPSAPSYGGHAVGAATAYPSLRDFMGLELTEDMIRENMPEYLNPPANNAAAAPHHGYGAGAVAIQQPAAIVPARNNAGVGIVAPISGSTAVIKSMVTHGVRHLTINKDAPKLGLRVRSMNTGVFACLVTDGSPAARAGLRFGDQILQIDGQDMAGLSVDKVHAIFKKKNDGQSYLLAVRDRPFERSVTLVRDSLGNIGFQFRDGEIVNIVKDSSAARNGLLTGHNLLEINGKNVIGLKDKEITKVIGEVEGNALNVTVMPTFLYKHMVKEMAGSLFGRMDHSYPDF